MIARGLRRTVLCAAPGFSAERTSGGLRVRGPRLALDIPPIGTVAGTAFETMFASGIDEDGLGDSVLEGDGFAALPMFSYVLRQLERSAAVARREYAGSTLAITVVPVGSAATERTSMVATDSVGLSRFCAIRQRDGCVVLESPMGTAYIVLHDRPARAAATALLTERHHAESLAEAIGVDADYASIVIDALARAALLDTEDAALATWEFHDLLFHTRSRLGRISSGYGGTYRFGPGDGPQPPIAPSRSDTRIALPHPDLAHLRHSDPPLQAVIEARRSRRAHSVEPLDLSQLGEFLFRTARARDDGSRPYPAGGGLYELELYLSIDRCRGLERGLYHYRATDHALEPRNADVEIVDRLLDQAATTVMQTTRPQVLITIAARFERVAWKYEAVAYSLILKHVGVLYEAMYLAATAMGLAACALGGGDTDLFGAAADLRYGSEGAVGEFVLGRPAEDSV